MPITRCGPTKARRSRSIARRQAHALRERLGQAVRVDYAMRYGNPGIAAALDAHGARGMHAHPRRAALSAILRGDDGDARTTPCSRRLARMRWQPALRTLPPYYDDPLYIEALAANLTRQLAALDFEPQRLLLELPRNAAADARARRSLSLPLPEDRAAAVRGARIARSMSPSSRASAAPNGSSRRRTRPSPPIRAKGVTRVAVAAPGFSADCLETLEELGIRGRETFLPPAASDFALLECLNDFAEGDRRCSNGLDQPRTCRVAAAAT